MLGDVGDPELVALGACELAVHEIAGAREVRRPLIAGPSCHASPVGASHQQRDSFMPDFDSMPERQLGVHAPRAVDATEVSEGSADQICEPRVTHRPLRRPMTLCVEQRLGVRVAGIDAAPDGRLDPREGNIHSS